MTKKISLTILLTIIVAGCAQTQNTTQTGLANPAAVYCEEQGHEYRIREGEAGQYGVCIINGEEKDAWQHYRENQGITTCQTGDCCREQNKGTSTKDCEGNWFYENEECVYKCYEEKLEKCGVNNPCAQGQCITLGGSAYCVTGDPCTYANCGSGKTCAIAESYPMQLICS